MLSHDHPEGHVFPVHTKVLYRLTEVLTLNLSFCLCNGPPAFSYTDTMRTQSYNIPEGTE